MRHVVIAEFPEYVVTDFGEIFSEHHEGPLRLSFNTVGVLMVGLYQEGRLYRRSVAKIVAEAFVDVGDVLPEDQILAPIHLNGDRADCRADNLAWRTRSFAVRYHKEMTHDVYGAWDAPILELGTGRVYNHPREVAAEYGALQSSVVRSVHAHGMELVPNSPFRYTWADDDTKPTVLRML